MADPTPDPAPKGPTPAPAVRTVPPSSAPAPSAHPAAVPWDKVLDHVQANAQTRGPGIDATAMGREITTALLPIALRYLGQFFHFVPKV